MRDRRQVPAPAPRKFSPFSDFVGPARRRTDHPLVVGTIVLCCGLIAIGSVLQIGATLWAGSQVKVLIDKDRERDVATETMRTTIIKFSESQAMVMRMVCLNTAKSEKDRADCLVPVPTVTPRAVDH